MRDSDKTLAIVLGKLRPGKKDKEEDGAHEGEMAAAEEAMAAIKDDDAEAFAAAMKAFIEICLDEGY